ARRPGHDARFAPERLAKRLDALARLGARPEDGVAEAFVEAPPEADGLLRPRLSFEQIGLVDDEAGVEVVGLGHHEEAVHEARVELGLERRLDAPRGVHVGRDDVLAPDAPPGRPAAELVAAR